MEKLIFKSYSNLVEDIRANIHLLAKHDFDLVVGIPRSGMIPAYLISAYLNIDCCDVDSFIENRPIQRGITRTTKGALLFPQEASRVLLIDDSIYSGDSLAVILSKIPMELHKRIMTAVIYATGEGKGKVDFFIESLEGKKLFEWGIFHNNLISSACFDMDGVLCRDCTPEENDEGVKYLNFIRTADPLFIPTKRIHTIITNRLEAYREDTEDWLKRHSVQYDNLLMLDLPNKLERNKIDAAVEHKGRLYKQLRDTYIFIESSINQAQTIALVSGKPVYCVDLNVFIEPKFNSVLRNNFNGLVKTKYFSFKHKVKMVLLNLLGK